jgi:hypothetical protein
MNQELTIDDQILTWLHYWNITTPIKIDEEIKEAILEVLSNDHTVRVYIDEDGGLVAEGDE